MVRAAKDCPVLSKLQSVFVMPYCINALEVSVLLKEACVGRCNNFKAVWTQGYSTVTLGLNWWCKPEVQNWCDAGKDQQQVICHCDMLLASVGGHPRP